MSYKNLKLFSQLELVSQFVSFIREYTFVIQVDPIKHKRYFKNFFLEGLKKRANFFEMFFLQL